MSKIDDMLNNLSDEDIEIPSSLRDKVNDTYKMIPEKKNKRKSFKRVAGVAIVITALLVTNIANPAFAEGIPIIGPTFEILNKEFGFSEKYNEYGLVVNEEFVFGDIILKVENIVYDGFEIKTFYKITSKNKLEKKYYPYIEYNLGEIQCGQSQDVYIKDDYTIYGVNTAIITSDDGKGIIDKMKLSIGINKLDCEDGTIELFTETEKHIDVNLDRNKMGIESVKVNKDITVGGSNYKIESVEETPLNIMINYKTKFSKMKGEYNLEFLVLDKENGPIWHTNGIGSGTSRNDKFISTQGYSILDKEAKNLIIIPVETYNPVKESEEAPEYLETKIDIIEGKTNIGDFGDYGSIKIDNVRFENGELIMDITATGYMMFDGYLDISDNEGNFIFEKNEIRNKSYDNGEFKYTVVYKNLDENKNYHLRWSTIKDSKTTILENEKFEVNFN